MTLNQHCMHTYNYTDDVTLNVSVKHSLSLLVCAIMTLEIDLV